MTRTNDEIKATRSLIIAGAVFAVVLAIAATATILLTTGS